jgi:hypothetical protein
VLQPSDIPSVRRPGRCLVKVCCPPGYGEPPVMLGDQDQLEGAGAVAGNLDSNRSVPGQHRLAAVAVAVVDCLLGRLLMGQVVAQFRLQGALDQRISAFFSCPK